MSWVLGGGEDAGVQKRPLTHAHDSRILYKKNRALKLYPGPGLVAVCASLGDGFLLRMLLGVLYADTATNSGPGQ